MAGLDRNTEGWFPCRLITILSATFAVKLSGDDDPGSKATTVHVG